MSHYPEPTATKSDLKGVSSFAKKDHLASFKSRC